MHNYGSSELTLKFMPIVITYEDEIEVSFQDFVIDFGLIELDSQDSVERVLYSWINQKKNQKAREGDLI